MRSQIKQSILIALMTLLLLCSSIHAAIIPDKQWQANHGTSGPDYAYAITVDDSGNVYVTGFTSLDMGSLTTIKYGIDGNEVWATHRMFFAPVSLGFNESSSLMVDGLGNVFVSMPTWHAIIKYDTNGDELWMSWYDDPELRCDPIAHAMAIDSQGNVYVTGEGYYDDTDYDYATIAFSPDGDTLWRARYNSSGENSDYAAALAVDEMQNVYVTGNSGTIKYDPNGSEVWVIPDDGQNLAIDALGNILVTGHGATNLYSPEGTIIWHLHHTFDPHEVVSSCLEVDSISNTLVLDSVDKGPDMDFVTTKIDDEGHQLWQNLYTICGSSAGNSDSRLWIDAEDNIYIFCFNDRDYLWDKAQAVIKYDPDGNMVWTMRPGNTDPDWMDVFSSMTVDGAGNVYLAGSAFDWSHERIWDYKTVKYTQREANIYTIVTSAGLNGSVDPNGPTLVAEQQTVQFTATPDSGYLVDKWYLDGAPLDIFGPVCTLESIDSNHALHVTFENQVTHLVTAEILGEYPPGSEPALILISGSSDDSVSVEPGDNLHFKVFPEDPPGPNIYTVNKWYLDGVEVRKGGLSYHLCNINADHTVGITLKNVPEDFEHTASAGANGSILCYGFDWCEAQADSGYVVDEWYLDGIHVQNGLDRYELYDNQNCQIQVTFAEPSANLEVLAAIGRDWGRTDCWDSVHCKCDCFDADLNLDHSIDAQDLALLIEFWLQPVTAHGIQTIFQYEKVVKQVRIAIDAYKLQHIANHIPGAGTATFKQSLTGCTNYFGGLVPCTDPDALGPYLQRIPWNPFSSVDTFDLVREGGAPAGANTHHWRYDTTIDMIEGDDTADHELPVAENWNLRPQAFLQPIRDAIMLYKYEHCNTLPTYGSADFEECMAQITDEAGDVWVEGVSSGSMFGPYLRRIPVNPFDGLNTVEVDGIVGNDTHGWHFNSENGNFQFDDSWYTIDGMPHYEY